MAATVRTQRSPSISVTQGATSTSAVVVKRGTDITLQTLKNVDATTLADGYTLIYDEATQKFKTEPLANVTLNAVDGGTY